MSNFLKLKPYRVCPEEVVKPWSKFSEGQAAAGQ